MSFEIKHEGRLDDQWFKTESLRLLGEQLAINNYASYPAFSDRLWCDDESWFFEPIMLPMGPWETSNGELPSLPEQADLYARGIRLDAHGRPLHPWFDTMITDPAVGIVTGKGRYWHWGPNYTADPIVIRRDLEEPYVLLIERADGTGWALPGGFIDGGESGVAAAVRETHEEAGIDLTVLAAAVDITYQGPLSDIRTTANAWPETTAVRFELPDTMAARFTERLWQGGDDAKRAGWFAVSSLNDHLFGSHSLLIKQALT